MTSDAGYSGTPLPKKLGFKPGQTILLLRAPAHYHHLVAGSDVAFVGAASEADAAHVFLHGGEDIASTATRAISCLRNGGTLWLSWAKKSSPLHAGITEDGLRTEVLPLGWVDVKVCAVDADWSGLKFLKRKGGGNA